MARLSLSEKVPTEELAYRESTGEAKTELSEAVEGSQPVSQPSEDPTTEETDSSPSSELIDPADRFSRLPQETLLHVLSHLELENLVLFLYRYNLGDHCMSSQCT